MAKIVLASGSPRRQELLNRIGITEFDIRVPETDEHYPAGLSPAEIVEYISREKAAGAQGLCGPDEVFVTADTMVFLDGARLGKPKDESDALRMLTALQGREHSVCTGVTVGKGETLLTRSEETFVRFLPASQERLRRYIASSEPMDKAGAYGIQGLGAVLVAGIRGDYSNVVGLPIPLLAEMLGEFGIPVL